ncbi:MAG TPA: TonB-dependent siderophore receptor [Steroidobacteraceae bacterium]|nr:TonB-dependent siderophore receptor [Steroidobacteraceae bacterium]
MGRSKRWSPEAWIVAIPALAGAGGAMAAEASPEGEDSRPAIVISATRIGEETSSATGLVLTQRETPQSVTIIDRDRIQDLALTNANDLLDHVPGLNVERVETDRTYFNARGFDVTSLQIDGIGLPLISGIQFGDLDTVLWDRVEVVRGANGMMTGIGNPSATINYVRKRPTATFAASLTGMVGSWDEKRIEADVSGPLDQSGMLAGRLILAHEDRDSYLDFNKVARNVYGALLSWDLTGKLKATTGYMRQDNDADGVLWGALPLIYSDGTQIQDYPRSASTSADWTYWNVRDQTTFTELRYTSEGGWSARGILTYHRFQESAKLLYAFGYPDRGTGLGIVGMSGVYPSDYKQYLIDVYASGPVSVLGREQHLAFGVSAGRSDGHEYEGFSDEFPEYPDYRLFGQVQLAEPAYPAPILRSHTSDRLVRAYAAAHLDVTDRLKGVLGVSAARLVGSGTSYGTDQSRDNTKASPYVGALYDLTPNLTLYASYTGIFNPQIEVDFNNRKLPPAVGSSYEGGIKSEWFDRRLYATIAGFRVRQNDLATVAGVFGPDDPNGPIGGTYYSGVNTTSTGFELEVAGRLNDRWSLNGGYTRYTLDDDSGGNPRPYLPDHTLKLGTAFTVLPASDLQVGADLRWQNSIYYVDNGIQTADGNPGLVRQPGYAVLDVRASMRIVDRLQAHLNLRNVADRKYLSSLMWGQAYYAAPRSVSFSVSYVY